MNQEFFNDQNYDFDSYDDSFLEDYPDDSILEDNYYYDSSGEDDLDDASELARSRGGGAWMNALQRRGNRGRRGPIRSKPGTAVRLPQQKPKQYYKNPPPQGQKADTKQVANAFGAVKEEVLDTQAAVKTVHANVQADNALVQRKLHSHDQRITRTEYATALASVLETVKKELPQELLNNSIVNNLLESAPTLVLANRGKGFLNDPKYWALAFNMAIPIFKLLLDKNKNMSGVQSVTVTPPAMAIVQGQTADFTAVARDSSGNKIEGKKFTWFTANGNVATVTDGKVSVPAGAPAGTVTIYVQEDSSGMTASASVTVLPAPTQ